MQAPGPDFFDLLEQRFQRQGVFAIAQQVVHQQLFNKWLKADGQLGEKHPEVFQHLLSRQRFTRLFDTNARAVDQVQLAALAQQVVQVQVFLPQALEVHLADGR